MVECHGIARASAAGQQDGNQRQHGHRAHRGQDDRPVGLALRAAGALGLGLADGDRIDRFLQRGGRRFQALAVRSPAEQPLAVRRRGAPTCLAKLPAAVPPRGAERRPAGSLTVERSWGGGTGGGAGTAACDRPSSVRSAVVVGRLALGVEQHYPGCGDFIEQFLREGRFGARLKRPQKRHPLIGGVGDDVGGRLESRHAQQAIVVGRLLLERDRQPFVVGIELLAHTVAQLPRQPCTR